MTQELYLELAGFLRMISQGFRPSNLESQARELENKLGDAMKEEHPSGDE